MIMIPFIWIASIVTTVVIAIYKNQNIVVWFLLSLILGPIALIFILFLPKVEQEQANISNDQYSEVSLESIKAEFESLKNEVSMLSNKLHNLGEKISILEAKEMEQIISELEIPEEELQPSVSKQVTQEPKIPKEEFQPPVLTFEKELVKPPTPSDKFDMEMNLGKFWLNKIGMIVFSLGVAFLLVHTFTHIGPLAKILLAYLIAIALFIIGTKLEKMERFINYGRVLLGGGWAVVYVITYGMYHFEASKIIDSQLLDLFFLAVVALGIIIHSLYYKSEVLTAIALFIGYFTSVLGNVEYFSLISSALLGIVAIIMVYKMQWIRFIFLGIILTYLTHFLWIIKQIYISRVSVGPLNVENVYFLLDAGFISIYWLLFTIAIHVIKNTESEQLFKKLAVANLSNFILFFISVYPKFYIFYPEHKFHMVIGLGLAYMVLAAIMNLIKRNQLFISNIIIGISALTLSVPLKFIPYHTIIIWFIELPFLLYAGFIFKQRVYRYLAFALLLILFIKFLLNWTISKDLIDTELEISLYLIGFISTAICFCLYRFLQTKTNMINYERPLQNFYSGFSVGYLTMYFWKVVKPSWQILGLSFEALLIFGVGILLLDKYIRWYALIVLGLACIGFWFYDGYRDVSKFQHVLLVYGPIACAFTKYFIYQKLIKKSLIPEIEVKMAKLLFFVAGVWLVLTMIRDMSQIWITLNLGIVAILSLLWGIKISDKYIRVYSLLILLLMAGRFLLIDTYYDISNLSQWLFICAKLSCAYGVYFIYRVLDKKSLLDESERFLVSPLFYGSSFLVVLTIFNYIKDTWITVTLGIVGVSLFVTGFLIKEKVFRHGGFIIFGLTLGRIAFVDLAGLPIIYKIISFIILGILFLGVSFIYTRYMTETPKQEDIYLRKA